MNDKRDTARELKDALDKCCPVCGEEAETFDVPWPYLWSTKRVRMCGPCADREHAHAGDDDANDDEAYNHGEDE